jgi:membrane protease YdiL (CAAX protease family)
LNKVRRYLEVVLFVLSWMAMGWIFQLDANSYLLVGIPLGLFFQLLVRREPLAAVWVRDAAKFHLDKAGILLALCLMILPSWLLQKYSSKSNLASSLWFVFCVLGAVFAAFSICSLNRPKVKALFLCLVTVGTIGCLIMMGSAALRHVSIFPSFSSAPKFLTNLAALFNVCFVMEEVVFRGVLDSHLYRVGESGSWFSAVFISTLWGLWHLPISGVHGALRLVGAGILLILIHSLIGVPLSFYWRKSGNLAVPGFTHAFIDAFRNTLFR